MRNDPLTTSPAESFPFVLERHWAEEEPNRPVPATRLFVTPMLRDSGLLAALPDEAARTLLAILCHVHPNGWIRPALSDVADALGIPVEQSNKRVRRLETYSFRGEALVRLIAHESGLETVHPARTLVGEQEESIASPEPETPVLGSRDRVVSESRARYGTPRAEAERLVLAQLGHYPEETAEGPVGDAWRSLAALGVPGEQVAQVMETYPLESIRKQLEWLPLRGDVRNPARFVVAAIQGDYDPPARVRLEQALEAMEAGEQRNPAKGVMPEVGEERAMSLPELKGDVLEQMAEPDDPDVVEEREDDAP